MKLFYPVIAAFMLLFSLPASASENDILETHYFSDDFEIPNYIAFKPSIAPQFHQLNELLANYWKGSRELDLRLKTRFQDQMGGVHYKYVQTFKGYDITFAEWIVHTKNDRILSMNGKLVHQDLQSAGPSLSENEALGRALDFVDADLYKWEIKAEEALLKQFKNDAEASYFPSASLEYVSKDLSLDRTQLKLCYRFDIYAHEPMSRQEIFVDAQSGEILFANSLINNANTPSTAATGYSGNRSITSDSLSANSFRLRQTSMGGGVNTYDLNQSTNFASAVDFTNSSSSWNIANAQLDQYALDAHWGTEQTYDYMQTRFGRNSINNSGLPLNSYVHYGNNYVNAFWNGQWMTYGDGNGSSITPLTSLDIVAHEIGHGLTSYTADLIYNRESGALNESFSDILGTSVEFYARPSRANWTVGEDIGITIRNMSNPNQYGDPDTYGGTFWVNQVGCIPTQQNNLCGIHTNMGVQNFWFYLLSAGGTGTNDNSDAYSVNGIGITKASEIAYRNLSVYLLRTSNFQEARFFAIRSAIDLYGPCSIEVEAVTRAWYAVGVGPDYINSVIADFSSSDTISCSAPLTVSFADRSTNAIAYHWDFGNGNSDSVRNPVHTYTTMGRYDVTLIADGGSCGVDTLRKTAYVDIDTANQCIVILNNGPNPKQIECTGKLLDGGGSNGNYSSNQNSTITIEPAGASAVTLNFLSFDVESGSTANLCDYDFLEVYDGDSTNAPLIGRYCNNQAPPSSITSTRGAVTLVFSSDQAVENTGFDIDWSCAYPSAAPTADFGFDLDTTCVGLINFTDRSTQAPNSWLWDFGDGNTSTLRDPAHNYTLNGTYTVSLATTNSFGSDTVRKSSIIHVNRPLGPTVVSDTTCLAQTANLTAVGNGDLRWFDQEFDGRFLHIGSSLSFNQPANDSTFWVENYITQPTQIAGPANNSFGTGNNFNGDHHLVFDVFKTMILESVFVYPYSSGQRTIELRDASGTVLQSRTVFISNTNGRAFNVNLDFTIDPGTDYQLGVNVSGVGPQLYRNNTGASYPYTIPGLVSIKRSSANSNPLAFYYFFYNWRVKEPDCVSPRVPISASLDTNCSIVGLAESLLESAIRIYPNPTNGFINVTLPSHQTDLEISLWDIAGKKIKDLYAAPRGVHSAVKQFDVSELPSGLYLIRINSQTQVLTERLIIH